MTPLEFLKLLWLNKPEGQFILLWTLPEKRSRWFRELAAAAEYVSSVHGRDVYMGVGLSKQDHGPAHRCVSDEIATISGFWADLDLRSERTPPRRCRRLSRTRSPSFRRPCSRPS